MGQRCREETLHLLGFKYSTTDAIVLQEKYIRLMSRKHPATTPYLRVFDFGADSGERYRSQQAERLHGTCEHCREPCHFSEAATMR